MASQNGLIKYKEGWGGKNSPLVYMVNTDDSAPRSRGISQNSPLTKYAGYILSHFPASLYKLISPYLMREFG